MWQPSNLSSTHHLELYLHLAEAALKDPALQRNHVEGKIPAWLNAYKEEAEKIVAIIVETDLEFTSSLKINIQRVTKALLAYPNFLQQTRPERF